MTPRGGIYGDLHGDGQPVQTVFAKDSQQVEQWPSSPTRSDELREAKAEIARLTEILNTPHIDDFLTAAVAEAKHQRFRWGDQTDAKKTAWDWFWLLGYLGGKAAQAALAGDLEKARHHAITVAATMANWHRHLLCAASGQKEKA